MAKKRLNDTAALVSVPLLQNEEHSIRVRKIDNGYIVNTTNCNPRTGEYRSQEQYTASEPRIIPGRVARQGVNADAGASPLKDTMQYLSDRDGRAKGG